MTKMEAVLSSLGEEASSAFMDHIKGGTSARWLTEWLSRAGHQVGYTTVKDFRKKVLSVGK